MNLLSSLGADGVSSFTVLGEDGERVLCRGSHDNSDSGRSAVLAVLSALEFPTPGFIDRLAHEYELKDELDGWSTVRPLALAREHGRTMLLLEDPGGEPLDQLLAGPMEIGRFLRIATGLSSAIGQLHQRSLIHKDIKPANVLADFATGRVWLTGFGVASRLPRERQAPAPPESIAGTLAYMAPEQTGRMNRSIDARSDLYALGVTLYQMLTGSLPFAAADPMEWVHCHIARKPVPPSDRLATIPAAISDLILKLLAKTAEERYQTAAGVERDLRRCLAAWETQNRIHAFPLGQHDTPNRLLIPEKLYGREREIDTLVAAFDRVVARGTPELILVSGFSGIGKSSVVNELHRVLVPPRGLFAAGKFDQYAQDIPYSTLAQAFQSLVRYILSKSDAEVSRWRESIREALGANGQLIVNLIPQMELLIGKQSPVPDLAPQDAQNRFQLVLRRLIGAFARPEHPLALFLDDLQWLDAATLTLLADLVTRPEIGSLLLVGAYRDNEVSPSHPLMRTLGAIREAAAPVHDIVLAPLGVAEVARLLADALHCGAERAEPLAQLVHEKTGGNPLFAIQFLMTLGDEQLLTHDATKGGWTWDVNRIRAKGYTDNVVDLMVGRLNRLSDQTREALKDLACLGNAVEIATLKVLYGHSEQVAHSGLWEAVRAGLVFDQDGAYRFLHDRIQQAAYSLIPEVDRATAHLRIGRALLADMTPDDLDQHLFDVANQFNRSIALVVDGDEKAQVATINLRAGRKAKGSAAHASGRVYLATGMALLDDEDWTNRYELTFNLWLEAAECEFLASNFDKAEQLIEELLRRGATKIDKGAAAHLKVQLHVVKSEYAQAVDSVIACLRLFGIDIPAHPTWKQVQAEYEEVWRNLEGRQIEDLVLLPLMTDPELLTALRLLSDLSDTSYFTDINLSCLHPCRMMNISIQHGVCGATAHACGFLAFYLGSHFGSYADGLRFAKLGCELVEKYGFTAFRSKVYHMMGAVSLWTQPIALSLDYMRASYRTATETGELTFACFSLYHIVKSLLARNDPLDAVWDESQRALAFVRRAGFRDIADMIVTQQRFVATMRGRTATFSTFSDAQFDEAAFESQLAGDRLPWLVSLYWILKLKARFLSGDYAEALAAAKQAKEVLWGQSGQIVLLDYYCYTALTVAALYDKASTDEQAAWRELLTAHRKQLGNWAENYPPTFGDKLAVVSAEIARLEGRDSDAMRLYEQAIQWAHEHGFVQNEGLAHEVAARFYAARGFETIANAYLRNARHCYLRWGADGKVRQLDRLFPQLATPEGHHAATTIGSAVQQLDVATVVKASQAVSSEIVLSKLVERLMTIALENAGADRGLLILLAEDAHLIQAEAKTTGDQVEVALGQKKITGTTCPESIIHYVIRTQESVILDDASRPNLFSEDDYLRSRQAKSILCLPLIKQGRLTGLLYLENTLTPHAFAADRIAILELLAAQAAISLENTRLYSDLQEREAKVRRLIDSNIIGIFIWDFEGRIIEANEAFLHMVGQSRDDLVSGRVRWTELTPADWHDTSERAVADLRATGTTKPYEKEFFRKDGTRLPILIGSATFGAARDEGVAFVLDLTERKQAEASLEEFLTFERLLADLSARFADNSIVQVETEIDSALTQLQEFLGFDRSNFFEFTADGRATIIGSVARAGMQRHSLGPAPAFLSWYLGQLRAGKVMRVQSIEDLPPEAVEQIAYHRRVGIRSSLGLPLRVGGRIVGVITFAAFRSTRKWSDDLIARLKVIGEVMAQTLMRKRAEDALRESEQQFRDFAEAASDWYWETGPDHRFIAHLVSEQQLNAIGVLSTSRIGKVRWDFARDLEEEPEKWRLHMADLDAHRPFRDFRYRAASRDGSEIYISASGKPIFDPKGNFLGYRGVASHISAAVRAALLEEALQEAKVVGDNIAHDLRTPLTRVRLRLERGREHAATLEEMREVANQAIAGLDQSLTTITALLRITEIEHSRRREGFGEVQLAPLVREAGDLYDPIAENKGVTLRVDAADGPIVRGDRDLLFEAVANLVDNAVKFTPEGGRVELALLHQEGEIVIRVSDTGPGIPEIEREAVTQRFYRSDKSRDIKGLGLGLSMVAAIIKLHGFRLTISTGPGCTTEIVFPSH
jgi:PAS domain S-box-containing protein